MATREDEMNELTINISTAITTARELKLARIAYILSMALAEALEATKAGTDDDKQDKTP
jgi:hypothetical protein